MDTGLLILRVVLGMLLLGHGAQRLGGWFGGSGLAGTSEYLESLGYRPAVVFAALSGLAEAIAGLLLLLGLGAPVAAAVIVANFVNAYRGHVGKGVWNDNGGWELPLLFSTAGAVFGFTGFGAYSLDDVLGWNIAGNEWGAAALVAGIVAGLSTQLIGRRAASTQSTAPTTA